jgi:transposase
MSQITVLTGPERHRRWREDERRQILTAAFAPGASVADVARQYDVATSLIYKWRQQAVSASRAGTSFRPAVVVDEPACSLVRTASVDKEPICVELSDGTRVRIGATEPGHASGTARTRHRSAQHDRRYTLELDVLENAMRLWCRECFVQCSRGVGREIVQNDADQLRLRVVRVDEITHALSEVLCRLLLRGLHVAPASVRVEKDEQVRSYE